MKRLILSIMLFTVTLFLAGCFLQRDVSQPSVTNEDTTEIPQEEEKDEQQEIDDKQTDISEKIDMKLGTISFKLPNYFTYMSYEDFGGLELILYQSKKDMHVSVNIVKEPTSSLTLDEYIQLSMNTTGFHYLEDGMKTTASGISYHEAVSSSRVGVKITQRTFEDDGYFYVVTFGSKESEYNNFIDIFDEITESVEFGDPFEFIPPNDNNKTISTVGEIREYSSGSYLANLLDDSYEMINLNVDGTFATTFQDGEDIFVTMGDYLIDGDEIIFLGNKITFNFMDATDYFTEQELTFKATIKTWNEDVLILWFEEIGVEVIYHVQWQF